MMTLFEKIWNAHVVDRVEGGLYAIYIDRHYIHEVTSPQAFEGLRQQGLPVFRRQKTIATADHNVPTIDQHLPIKEAMSRFQVEKLIENCNHFGVELYGLGHERQGIVHVIGPELGMTKPGMTIVCGDSHTSTHGAFGCIAFGIGTSQVEHVFAAQSLLLSKPKTMRISIEGKLDKGVGAKDVILYVISQLGASGGTGYFVEYAGSTIQAMTMEERMTVCNMSIEMGARGGMIAPDQTTYDYLKGRPFAPDGEKWEEAVRFWNTLYSDGDAVFDVEYAFDAEDIAPMITYGTNPGMGIGVEEDIPFFESNDESAMKSLQYMGLESGKSMLGLPVQYVFIGSCTNARIEDLRVVAGFVKGKKVAEGVGVLIVPGSQKVAQQAMEEGLDVIFADAGMPIREAGCSACLGMNEDKIPRNAYCVSTSNRNFEGRQGPGARTILASPLTAAAAAIYGKIVDVRQLT